MADKVEFKLTQQKVSKTETTAGYSQKGVAFLEV